MAQPGEIKTMDVCIGMDVTGSMGTWIHASRDSVIEAVNELRTTFPNCVFRMSFVAYRDFGDEIPFVIIPFTEDVQSVQREISMIKATGGNDTPEDVAGALEHITALDWSSEKKLVFFVADAPPHGTDYHSITMGDRYPEGDPNGRNPKHQMAILGSMGIDFTIFRVTSQIDMMIEAFAESYKDEKATGLFKVLDVEKQLNESDQHPDFSMYKIGDDEGVCLSLGDAFYDYDSNPLSPSSTSDMFKKGLVLMATDSLSH
jgi:hypothetical protein